MYKKTNSQLSCEECGAVSIITPTVMRTILAQPVVWWRLFVWCSHQPFLFNFRLKLGLEKIVDETARILPDLAKEAFLSAQEVSFTLKVPSIGLDALPGLPD